MRHVCCSLVSDPPPDLILYPPCSCCDLVAFLNPPCNCSWFVLYRHSFVFRLIQPVSVPTMYANSPLSHFPIPGDTLTRTLTMSPRQPCNLAAIKTRHGFSFLVVRDLSAAFPSVSFLLLRRDLPAFIDRYYSHCSRSSGF